MRIAMWSGPRNLSTAMMYAFAQRADCAVMDEPFYAAYLATTGLDHPMRDEVLAAQSRDWSEVAAACAGADAAPIVFQKHMCQHMIAEAPLGWMTSCRHAFLIRPPAEVATSFSVKWDGMTAEDLGFRRQAELFDHVCQIAGSPPPVVLARDVLSDPERTLRALCGALGVAWDPAMLSWPAGPHPDDGVWAAHWYNAVIRSTGFGAPGPETTPVPEDLADVVAACQPHFDAMARYRLVI